jgi:N-acetylmuramoyl-L-alanine amidase
MAAVPGPAAVRATVTPTVPAKTHASKKIVPLSPWEQAQKGREAFEAIPEESRGKADYTCAMDGYRAIYHSSPRDMHAPAAINAVAELLAEQGRGQHDAKASQSAVGQYEFLRTQYPTSSLRIQALLAEAQIEQNDLGDAATAKEKYKLLLQQHPRSEQAEEAKAALASLAQGPGSRVQGPGKTVADAGVVSNTRTHVADAVAQPIAPIQRSAQIPVQRPAPTTRPSLPAMPQTGGGGGGAATATTAPGSPAAESRSGVARPVPIDEIAEVDAQTRPESIDPQEPKHSGKKAIVTGIRHWSTATYTRVAIDLGDNVTYEAARVPNPDRIYFDLHGTRLAPELAGKSFAVTDDGFLKTIRAAQFSDDMTRVVLDVNDVTEYSAFLLPNPYRLIIDIHGKQGSGLRVQGPANQSEAVAENLPAPTPHTAVTQRPTVAKPVPNTTTLKQTSSADVAAVSEVPGRVEATSKPTSKPISAVVSDPQNPGDASSDSFSPAASAADVSTSTPAAPAKKTRKTAKPPAGTAATDATPARAAVPTADGQTSLVRALGLKIGRIVIDAGHGGHDSGTLGVDGIEEKDVVLDVALRLGKLLHDRLGAEIIYTRSDDTFVPLETRTAIANKAQADLFLSIHANSSSEPAARGVETYYLNFTSDPTALDVAARENAVSDQSIHQLSDLVKKIALKDKIAESREFATDVETSLYGGLQTGNTGLKNRGVKTAPFVVLIGANMPSILAEISFVTNPKDADQLRQPDYRQRVAESLYRGVARYEGGLSGTHPPAERAAGE